MVHRRSGDFAMTRCSRLRLSVVLALATALALASTAASAQGGKPWRHGIIEAKSDAGILFMAGN
jgi:hypothetical protein